MATDAKPDDLEARAQAFTHSMNQHRCHFDEATGELHDEACIAKAAEIVALCRERGAEKQAEWKERADALYAMFTEKHNSEIALENVCDRLRDEIGRLQDRRDWERRGKKKAEAEIRDLKRVLRAVLDMGKLVLHTDACLNRETWPREGAPDCPGCEAEQKAPREEKVE